MYLDLLPDQYFAVSALEAIMYWYAPNDPPCGKVFVTSFSGFKKRPPE
jgi:hypothetical protein